MVCVLVFFFSSRRRHTRCSRDGVQTCALPIWGDRTVAQVEPLVRIVFGVTVVLEGEGAPVDPEIGEVRNRRRGVAVRERLIDEMDDRHLVPVRVVEGQQPVPDALLEVPGRQENAGALAMARVEREPKVALLMAGRR